VVANGGPGFDHSYLHLSEVWDVLAKTRVSLTDASVTSNEIRRLSHS